VTIDLRSDTVTSPTPEMRRAMAEAEVGDDVYGEDPTVNRLQQEVAELLGFEAALFTPTGTMANEIAIRLGAQPGQLVLAEARSHVVAHELAGMAALSGVAPLALTTRDGRLLADHIHAAIKPPMVNRPEIALVVLENTQNLAGGVVTGVEDMRKAITACRELGLRVHVDGARIWNAAVALGREPREILAGAHTAMVALSKGLCCPVGSLLLCSAEDLPRARRIRQLFGGGMRQAGVLAAAGLVGLRSMRARLSEDHAHAAQLAAALAEAPGVQVTPPDTNIVVAVLERRSAPELTAALRARGVLAGAMDAQTLRLVTHHDVSHDDCVRAVEALRAAIR
jgi:threonine aldolase